MSDPSHQDTTELVELATYRLEVAYVLPASSSYESLIRLSFVLLPNIAQADSFGIVRDVLAESGNLAAAQVYDPDGIAMAAVIEPSDGLMTISFLNAVGVDSTSPVVEAPSYVDIVSGDRLADELLPGRNKSLDRLLDEIAASMTLDLSAPPPSWRIK